MGLGVDFVLPLSQQEQEQEQEEQQEEPHQNIPEGNIQKVLNFAKSHAKANQTNATPLPTLTTTTFLDINTILPLQNTISHPESSLDKIISKPKIFADQKRF